MALGPSLKENPIEHFADTSGTTSQNCIAHRSINVLSRIMELCGSPVVNSDRPENHCFTVNICMSLQVATLWSQIHEQRKFLVLSLYPSYSVANNDIGMFIVTATIMACNW